MQSFTMFGLKLFNLKLSSNYNYCLFFHYLCFESALFEHLTNKI